MKGGRVDYDEFARMADTFIEAGFNYFDTAHGYIGGQSETGTQGITITILLLAEVMERHLNVLNAENARRSVRSIFLSEIF